MLLLLTLFFFFFFLLRHPEDTAEASLSLGVDHAPPRHRQEEAAHRGLRLLTEATTSGSAKVAGAHVDSA